MVNIVSDRADGEISLGCGGFVECFMLVVRPLSVWYGIDGMAHHDSLPAIPCFNDLADGSAFADRV